MGHEGTFDITAWLTSLGLPQYAPAFVDNDVDAEILGELTADDLREMGVKSIGHRRRLLKAAQAVADSEPADPPAGAEPQPPAASPWTEGAPAEPSAERRNLTVMFCDLMDSTALSVNVDPEDLRHYLARFRDVVEAAVQPFSGHVAQYLGDGLLVYFGFPRSSEHDTESAVAAALSVVDDVARMEPFADHQPKVRIGIATGLTVVGTLNEQDGKTGEEAVGETPNLAARLQALATPNTVVIAPQTRQRIGDLFECTDLGSFDLKGFSEPVRAWRVDGQSRKASRFGALRSDHSTTAFVGREEELTRLRYRLAEAQEGRGQFAVIVGESGLGKSRLARRIVREACGTAESQPVLQCAPYNVGTPFHPFRYYIEQTSGVALSDTPDETARKLSAVISRAGPVTPERLALIGELIRAPGLDSTPLYGLSSKERRRRIMLLLLDLINAIARESTVITFEDIQWIDPSTAELFDQFLPGLASLPVLLLATMRPQDHPAWLARADARFISLQTLDREDTVRLIGAIAGDRDIPEHVVDTIMARSDGIPIFAEELARGYVEAASKGQEAPDGLSGLPASLSESLLARLDRLKAGRSLAQTAAVIGHEFPIAVLISVSGLTEAQARNGIDELLDADVLTVKHSPFGEAISFRHILLREAAYNLLLRTDRVRLHGQVARILIEDYAQIAESVPHIVAMHLEESGDFAAAAAQWDRAADQAAKRSAYAEAVVYLQSAIAANGRCKESAERDERELSFRLNVVGALIAAEGYSAEGVAPAMERAVELGRKTGNSARLVPALTAKWVVLGVNSQIDDCLEIAAQIAEVARDGSEVDRLLAYRTMATARIFAGRFPEAKRSLEAFLELYDYDRHEEALRVIGPSNHAAMMMLGMSEVYAFMADLDAAEHWRKRALQAADRNGEMHNICHTLLFAGCFVSALLEQRDALGRHADTLRTLATENELPYWLGHADLFHGLSLIRRGEEDEGFAEARRGVRGLIEQNAFNSCWYVLYAEACQNAGRLDEAAEFLALVTPAQAQGERWMAAEFHRIQGRLLLARGEPAEAVRAEYQAALKTAQAQGAMLFVRRVEADMAALEAGR